MATSDTAEAGGVREYPNWRAVRVVAGDWEDMQKIRRYVDKNDARPGGIRAISTGGLGHWTERATAEALDLQIEYDRIVVPESVAWNDTISMRELGIEEGPMDREWANVGEFLKCANLLHPADPRPVIDVMPRRETALQQEYEKRRRQDRDMKVIIYARDGQTGTGKTSLAVELAKSWDSHGWDAEKATLDPNEYVEKWHEVPEGSVILADEAEQQADSRRSMSKQNLSLTHAWATLRYQQVFSILTLPDPTYLDVRLRKGADFHIVVHERGRAVVYRSKIEDQSGELYQERCHTIRWDSVDGDPDYEELNRMKAERMEEYRDKAYFEEEDAEGPSEEDVERARIEGRNDVIRKMAARGDTHEEIAQTVGLDRSTVSKILSDG